MNFQDEKNHGIYQVIDYFKFFSIFKMSHVCKYRLLIKKKEFYEGNLLACHNFI